MAQPLLVILGIIVMGALLVIFPVGLATFYRYRNRKVITCPGTHGSADVQLNARRTALTTVFGRPLLAVQNCSLWPRKKGCERSLRQTELARAVIRGAPKSPVTKIQLMENLIQSYDAKRLVA